MGKVPENQDAPTIIIGMDVGSTTVKATVVNPINKKILWSDYQRHNTQSRRKKCWNFWSASEMNFPMSLGKTSGCLLRVRGKPHCRTHRRQVCAGSKCSNHGCRKATPRCRKCGRAGRDRMPRSLSLKKMKKQGTSRPLRP